MKSFSLPLVVLLTSLSLGVFGIETSRLNSFQWEPRAVANPDIYCAPGLEFDPFSQFCTDGQYAYGPFTEGMVLACEELQAQSPECRVVLDVQVGERTYRTQRWPVEFARALRGGGHCPAGALPKTDLGGFCEETRITRQGASVVDVFGPFPTAMVSYCLKELKAGDDCSFNRWSKEVFLATTAALGIPGESTGRPSGENNSGNGSENESRRPPKTKIDLSPEGIIVAAKKFVGFSYWWGAARLPLDAKEKGSCRGSCPNCTHQGRNGADCSGYIGKVWQLPESMPWEKNLHPFYTAHFVDPHRHWRVINRKELAKADALVFHKRNNGHIYLYEKKDAWGSIWTYEARSCSTGIVHNLRTLTAEYKAIRRKK